MTDMMAVVNALIAADHVEVLNLVQAALEEGAEAHVILNEGLIKGMDLVGERMEEGDMFIPEVLQCAQIMASALEVLKPHLGAGRKTSTGTIVFGTVKGDLHDIGKNLCVLMLKSSGFEVVDLGVDVSPEAFVEAARKSEAEIVGLSALLTTTMEQMARTVEAFKEAGLRAKVKIMIGGAPVSQKYADQIGADGFAPDAGSATKLAKALLA